ncbi:diguanylate cyclase [Azoarcus indigens]|uniref:PAS domain S-box-containing protein/diguanylate cyclase (GGDEF)-like protein n=1 Tax=Azoarcus indigens TaxID=29545 RepID=A0A4R6EEH3_9RHOO|nr:diguanylate cyclase [Azoarcus indigens]TDN56652.1 PAS domain S-box-containing protein/diguanylate cyclase (GGDEF)-like protein [Azoarcus indigens]
MPVTMDASGGVVVAKPAGALGATLAMLLFVLLAAWLAWGALEERKQAALQQRLQAEANGIALKVEERFRGYRQVLRGARALYMASDTVEGREWAEYVAGLTLSEDYRGIQGVGFSRWLTPAARLELEARMQAAGLAGYKVWPAGEREHYSAIVALEPLDTRNRRALGFDMFSEPTRREAMTRAVEVSEGALSGPVVLVQEDGVAQQRGVLLYLAVFRSGFSASDVATRWRELQGWVYSPFRMDDLMEGALGRFTSDMRLKVLDLSPGSQPALLFDSEPESGEGPANALRYERRLVLGGREWLLEFSTRPDFSVGERPLVELGVIVLIGSLLLAVTWSLAVTRARARALAIVSGSLRQREAQYRAIVNLSHEGIATVDQRWRLTYVNPRLAEMLRQSANELLGTSFCTYCPDLGDELAGERAERLRQGNGRSLEMELQREDGSKLTVLVSDAPLVDADGRLSGATLMVVDITERKAAERRINYLATHDGLTDIPNRARFEELLGAAIARAARYQHSFALLFVDLDHFKEVNDSHGHLVGDALLVEAVKRMKSCLRASDTPARQGGDEFVVLLPETKSTQDAERVAEKIRAELARPFEVEGCNLNISSSIGVVFYPQHGRDADALLRHADEAMYRAKSAGRNRVAVCDAAGEKV